MIVASIVCRPHSLRISIGPLLPALPVLPFCNYLLNALDYPNEIEQSFSTRVMPSEGHVTTTQNANRPFKRGYVACVGCRSRKVRCVLGNKPPCTKCVREHRECVFQNTRKPGKHREAPRWTEEHRRPTTQAGQVNQDLTTRPAIADSVNLDDQRVHEAAFEISQPGPRNIDNDGQFLSHRVMSSILARPSDALDVLFDAARSEHSPHREPGAPRQKTGFQSVASQETSGSKSGQISVSELSRPSEEVLDLWDRCRFVRQGWFTAQEAVTYLDL